ncbi:hypothetical protein IQ03_00404 [Gemmobacter caeni]|uniref:DUF805 domain-containing protein n=1 Tax=Gemmobacter caeni TaxID=589035 RepID=A0A2T6BBP7_9RHOB|nr:hypothetical protein [Gemmobacter caeni]PTX53489.1 hypothetical protein C8N34_101406 [Gemmobacter caeni]TWJ05600.1 hypothetical protein IQ03_00404 [Gemmobacter caeni]
MPDLPPDKIDAILAERARFFTAGWFRELLAGRMTPGETFWAGTYGPLLFLVPGLVLLAMLLAIFAPAASTPVMALSSIFFGIYLLVLLRALVRSTARATRPKTWPRVGIIVTLLNALANIGTGVVLLVA